MRSAEGIWKRRERDAAKQAELRKLKTHEDRKKRLEYHKAIYRRNRAERLAISRAQKLRRFGLSIEDYDTIHRAQGGVCAICRRPQRGKRLAVDHDHETGRVRGLLCASCNTGLGHFRDDPVLLYVAAAYLGK